MVRRTLMVMVGSVALVACGTDPTTRIDNVGADEAPEVAIVDNVDEQSTDDGLTPTTILGADDDQGDSNESANGDSQGDNADGSAQISTDGDAAETAGPAEPEADPGDGTDESDAVVTGGENDDVPIDDSASGQGAGSGDSGDGSNDDSDGDDTDNGVGGNTNIRSNFAFPQTTITNVSNGSSLQLSTELGQAERPILLWFWSPDCPACNAEAGVVEDFARTYSDKVDVVGVGSDGSLAKAEAFVERNGTQTPLVVWDDSPDTWDHYGVNEGPFSIMVDPSGAVMAQWRGMPPELFAFADRLP